MRLKLQYLGIVDSLLPYILDDQSFKQLPSRRKAILDPELTMIYEYLE